jgi:hypothetical protein
MPDEILIEIAAALAGKAAASLYDFVKSKLGRSKKGAAALEAAAGAAPGSPEVLELASELETAEGYDEEFGKQLRAQWEAFRNGTAAPSVSVVNNSNSGNATNIVQGRDFSGGVNIGDSGR